MTYQIKVNESLSQRLFHFLLRYALLTKSRFYAALPHFHLKGCKLHFGCINCSIYLVSGIPNTMYSLMS